MALLGMVRHGMVGRWGLGVPDVAGIAGELAGLEGPDDGVAVHDGAAGSVDDVGAPLHRTDQLVVEEVVGLGH